MQGRLQRLSAVFDRFDLAAEPFDHRDGNPAREFVVFRDEHAERARHLGFLGRGDRRNGGGRLRGFGPSFIESELEPEGRSLAGLAIEPHGSTHERDELARYRQTQARASMFAVPSSFDLGKALKHLAAVLRPNSRSGVYNGDPQRNSVARRRQDPGFRGHVAQIGKLDGVVGEIEEYLANPRRVSHQPSRNIGVDPVDQPDPFPECLGSK